VTLVGRPGGQVDRRLRVGREHDEQLTGRQIRHRALGEDEGERASETARVDRGHNAIVAKPPPQPAYALAAVITTRDPARMYSALSVLVSTAADGARCGLLLSFRGLELFTAVDLERRAADSGDGLLSPAGRETFARSLVELRDSAIALETIDVYACAATSETTLIESDLPVISTPRFLRETAGARLVFV
jgi:hypothetical protein